MRPHGRLEGYAGLFVAWRGDGAHVSAHPALATDPLQKAAVASLQSPDFWTSYVASLGGTVIGPATHHYLDVDPGPGHA